MVVSWWIVAFLPTCSLPWKHKSIDESNMTGIALADMCCDIRSQCHTQHL